MNKKRGGLLLIAWLAGAACPAIVDVPGVVVEAPPPLAPPPPPGVSVPTTPAVPRLSVRELDNILRAVLGVEGAARAALPPDPDVAVNPLSGAEEELFDTASNTKEAGQVFVEGLLGLASSVSRDVALDPVRLAAVAGCAPESGNTYDAACAAQLVDRVGPGLWRRPLLDEERSALLAAAADIGADAGHDNAARVVLMALLQSPAFLYRVEIGTDAGDGVRALNNHELIARLTTTLWGAGPTPELLERAAGAPLTDDELAALAVELLDDPRAEDQLRAFHRLWLRYETPLVTDTELATSMRAETDALVDDVLFGGERPWTDLFAARQSFVTPALAAHYGLPTTPETPAWVDYAPDDDRAGILAHGSFLSRSSTRQTDTLPSRRGAMVARRFLCQQIQPPPDDVDIDDGVPVEEGACKPDAYAAHASGTCVSCHSYIDGLGFGLERYDGQGRFRDVEEGNASCAIAGTGTVEGEAFRGPRGLGDWLVDSGVGARCGVEQLLSFTHRNDASRADWALVERLAGSFEDSAHDFRALFLAVVTDPGFRYRAETP